MMKWSKDSTVIVCWTPDQVVWLWALTQLLGRILSFLGNLTLHAHTANLHSDAELDISKWNAWVTLKDELKDNQVGRRNTPLESLKLKHQPDGPLNLNRDLMHHLLIRLISQLQLSTNYFLANFFIIFTFKLKVVWLTL